MSEATVGMKIYFHILSFFLTNFTFCVVNVILFFLEYSFLAQ